MARLAIAALALTGVVLMQRSQLNQPSLWVTNAAQAEQQERLRLNLLKQFPTFGFDNVVADWSLLNFLQYYGDTSARSQTGYSLSPDYFDIITRRDPRFVDSYLFLSGTVSYQLGRPDLAIQMMDRGTAVLSPQMHPKAFQVPRLKGLDQLLLLGDVPGSIRSHELAAQWVKDTPDRAFLPLFEATAAFLRKDPNSLPVRFQAWTSVYAQAVAVNDRQTQERAKREILSLGGRINLKDGQLEFVPPTVKPSPSKPPRK